VSSTSFFVPVHASPFVNEVPHPELAALRPTADSVANSVAATNVPKERELPELALTFKVSTPESSKVVAERNPYLDIWERIRSGFRVGELSIKEAEEARIWYARRPELVTNILTRSRYYLFHIVDEVEKRGMPMETALLPFVESGFNPRAISSAQALGLWQFIPETGFRYNLDQSSVYDARRDIIASTSAALDYLQFLYGMFGDWQLAFAAYNWGEKSVGAAIERNRAKGLPTDFASLTLPKETRNYLPKLLAVKRIIMSPASFGVALPKIENEPFFAAVAMPRGVDLKDAASLAGMEPAEFEVLNAAYALPHQHAAPMRAIIRTDKIAGFFERVRDFFQKMEFRRTSRSTIPKNSAQNPASKACCQRRQ